MLSVKGGVGAIVEYGGDGLRSLTVPERCTITNMGAELGATTSIFPSDEMTREFLRMQGRENDWRPLSSDDDAEYAEKYIIHLDELEALAACPHSPDNIKPVRELRDIKVDQVAIGSCTNSSLDDMMKVAAILKGKKIADSVSLSISPGSKQVLSMLTETGALTDMIDAGARLLECTCGPCIGMGFSPNSGGVSLRTFNRNFLGRSGTKDGKIYLVSPETAAAAALAGHFADPLQLEIPDVKLPDKFRINDSGIIPPLAAEEAVSAEIIRGPNIKPFPNVQPAGDSIEAKLILKVGDNITTDHIMPAGAKVLPYRSNIPKISEFCFNVVDDTFPERAKKAGSGIIVAGVNYGQGSSREHAALAPMYLGIKAVVAKSFARIHAANLVNAGILPLVFENPEDYDKLEPDDALSLHDVYAGLAKGKLILKSGKAEIPVSAQLSDRQIKILRAGGLLKYSVL